MTQTTQSESKGLQVSLDWWAVLAALALAALVKVGLIHKVPW